MKHERNVNCWKKRRREKLKQKEQIARGRKPSFTGFHEAAGTGAAQASHTQGRYARAQFAGESDRDEHFPVTHGGGVGR